MLRILNGLEETLFNIDDIFQHISSQDQYKRCELEGQFPNYKLVFLVTENIIQNHS